MEENENTEVNEELNNNSTENNENENQETSSNMQFEVEPQTEEERELKILKDKVEQQRKELEENDDRIKRLMAEFENFKKRSDKERTSMYNSVMGDVVTKLLPVIDNLEQAAAVETSDEQYKNGVQMVLNQFKEVLNSNGVKEIEAVGKTFDPSLHEAVSSVVDENLGAKVIKEEFRKGYTLGDKVLRHSLVVVAN